MVRLLKQSAFLLTRKSNLILSRSQFLLFITADLEPKIVKNLFFILTVFQTRLSVYTVMDKRCKVMNADLVTSVDIDLI